MKMPKTLGNLVLSFGMAIGSVAALIPATASAQTGPITLVVGFAPGGPVDLFARALADSLRTTSGRQVQVENRTGEARDSVADAANDGSVVFIHNSAASSAKMATLLPVVQIAETAMGVWQSPVRGRSSTDLANNGGVNVYLLIELNPVIFQRLTGVASYLPIRYSDTTAAANATALTGGFLVAELNVADVATNSGLRFLGMSSKTFANNGSLPNLPAQVLPGIEDLTIPIGVFVPQGAAEQTQRALVSQFSQAANNPDFANKIAGIGYKVKVTSGAQFAGELSGLVAAVNSTNVKRYFVNSIFRFGGGLAGGGGLAPGGGTTTQRDDPKVRGRSARGG